MLDAWLKGKFYSKCKTGIRMTKTRVDLIRKKRNAMQKYFKNDIADLLMKGLDVNAYGRSEGLLVELNLSRCYDLLEQYCQQISSNISVMNKERECPEDCKEAVSTLMFAAARFADLPELRDLRTIFTDRYGKSIDFFVNKEFVEKLKGEIPCKDMKLQLLQDIASEWDIEWNSKALEQKLYTPPPATCDVKLEKREDDDSDKYNTQTSLSANDRNKENESAHVKVPLHYQSIPPPYTKPHEPKKNGTLDNADNDRVEEEERVKPKSVRKVREAANGDHEEKRLDKLLEHYSKKKGASDKQDEEGGCSKVLPKRRSIDFGSSVGGETTPKGGHLRAASYNIDTCWNPNAHIHPKLPDYDDLIARLAAARSDQI
ncbi:unnamed protein product [Cuscuta europaea]|uniref:IST1-like protein n=1 Tax=Cuscuta europaea TaxID=41803 RepID=A0A9P0VNR9_CUSEU|nr:unnamed protein product [Cuscuta europaea]